MPRREKPSRPTARDTAFMRRALELSRRGEGFVEPNPMVGCVIAQGDEIVGEGWHRKFGGPHAEIYALRAAGDATRGSTVYVTLEPCSHFGKTPPCADALIAAGVRRVVTGVKDPNPLVAGRGIAKLRKAGIEVQTGLRADEARDVLAPFLVVQTENRPYVILKWAQSLDGKIATRTGDSQWITSPESRRKAHELRARVDAILVGIGTVLADDPALTARHVRPRRIATRIILDRLARTPLQSKLARTARTVPTLIACGPPPRESKTQYVRRIAALRRAGCDVRELPLADERIDLSALLRVLCSLGMTNVMVEGGGSVLGSFMDRRGVDEAHVYVAPEIIGGLTAPGPIGGIGPARMADIIGIRSLQSEPCGPDLHHVIKFEH